MSDLLIGGNTVPQPALDLLSQPGAMPRRGPPSLSYRQLSLPTPDPGQVLLLDDLQHFALYLQHLSPPTFHLLTAPLLKSAPLVPAAPGALPVTPAWVTVPWPRWLSVLTASWRAPLWVAVLCRPVFSAHRTGCSWWAGLCRWHSGAGGLTLGFGDPPRWEGIAQHSARPDCPGLECGGGAPPSSTSGSQGHCGGPICPLSGPPFPRLWHCQVPGAPRTPSLGSPEGRA